MTTTSSRALRLWATMLIASIVILGSTSCSEGEQVRADDGSHASETASGEPVLRGCDSPADAAANGYSTYNSFESLNSWADGAQAVARFEVVGEVQGPVMAQPIEGETADVPRYLDLRLTEVYAGLHDAGDVVRIWDVNGWDKHSDGSLDVVHGPECFRLEVGDDVIGALIGDGSDITESGLFTPESALLIQDDRIATTLRSKPVLDELEGRPVAEVIEMIRAAVR